MLRTSRLWMIVAAMLLAQLAAHAQARETIAMMRTRYNTARTQSNPQGEAKTRFETLEQDIARAARLGRTGELRRLYTQGMALAQNRPWNAEIEFAAALALQTDHIFVDPSAPAPFRLTQIYLPSIELAEPLTMRVALHRTGNNGEKLKDVGLFRNVGRDLIDSPFAFTVDFAGIEGRAVVRAELLEGGRVLGTTTLNMDVRKGLRERLSRLESDNPEVRFPADYIANVDKGNIPIGQFDYDRELTTAETALASIKAGNKDPFAGKTGDLKRHYFLPDAGEILPYRIYVPTSYKGDRSYPLLIALHGNGLTENYFFDNLTGATQRLAEERGYIVAAPLGYRVDGGFGYNNGSRPAEDIPKLELSEKDVMQVLELMKKDYRIDASRIYVAGHSMGGAGSWYLGPRYSQVWAGLGSFAGGATVETVKPVKHIPQFIVHGDADTTVTVERSRTMAAELKRLGATYEYVEVPGGTHGNVVAPNMKGLFDFFDRHKK